MRQTVRRSSQELCRLESEFKMPTDKEEELQEEVIEREGGRKCVPVVNPVRFIMESGSLMEEMVDQTRRQASEEGSLPWNRRSTQEKEEKGLLQSGSGEQRLVVTANQTFEVIDHHSFVCHNFLKVSRLF